eukprot:SAG31_NODE_200_length_20519_cov_57.688833_6_plen_862_part_00
MTAKGASTILADSVSEELTMQLGAIDAEFVKSRRSVTVDLVLTFVGAVIDVRLFETALRKVLAEQRLFCAHCLRVKDKLVPHWTAADAISAVRVTGLVVDDSVLFGRPASAQLFEPTRVVEINSNRSREAALRSSEGCSAGDALHSVAGSEVLTFRIATGSNPDTLPGRSSTIAVTWDHALTDVGGIALLLAHVSAAYNDSACPRSSEMPGRVSTATCKGTWPMLPSVHTDRMLQKTLVESQAQSALKLPARWLSPRQGGATPAVVEWSYSPQALAQLKSMAAKTVPDGCNITRHLAVFADVIELLRRAAQNDGNMPAASDHRQNQLCPTTVRTASISRDGRGRGVLPPGHFGNGTLIIPLVLSDLGEGSQLKAENVMKRTESEQGSMIPVGHTAYSWGQSCRTDSTSVPVGHTLYSWSGNDATQVQQLSGPSTTECDRASTLDAETTTSRTDRSLVSLLAERVQCGAAVPQLARPADIHFTSWWHPLVRYPLQFGAACNPLFDYGPAASAAAKLICKLTGTANVSILPDGGEALTQLSQTQNGQNHKCRDSCMPPSSSGLRVTLRAPLNMAAKVEQLLRERGDLPKLPSTTATVVWLHGLGDSGNRWKGKFPLERTNSSKAMATVDLSAVQSPGNPDASQHPVVEFIFPKANIRAVTAHTVSCKASRRNEEIPAWFDIKQLPVTETEPCPPADQLEEAVADIHRLLDRLILNNQGTPVRRVVLGGFSQGGALALHAGLSYRNSSADMRSEGSGLAGIVSISGWCVCRTSKSATPTALQATAQLNLDHPGRRRAPPVFFSCGTADEVVSFSLAKRSAQQLTDSLGKDHVTMLHVSRTAHLPKKNEIDAASRFMKDCISRSQ